MMLHEDRYAFLAILNRVHDVSGVRPDILEKDYYVSMLLRELYFDVAKRVYDVSIMLALPAIQSLLCNSAELLRMIGYKRLEETRRIGSDLADKPFRDYQIFHGLSANKDFEAAFQNMQRSYVFNESDIITMDCVLEKWNALKEILYLLDS